MLKKIVLLLILTYPLVILQANKVPGYIITNNTDTIYGKIKIPRFNLYTGGLVVYKINLEPFHQMVTFKKFGEHNFNKYQPGEISGFGFESGSTNYKFKSFRIQSKSIIKQDGESVKFLNLIFQGELEIYREIVRRPNYLDSRHISKNDRATIYYEYYLYNEKHGLHKVIWTKDYKTITELLKLYELDSRYLERLTTDVRFKDIKELMNDYERWKAL